MKLYITPGSPYARMARIICIEKGLENRVETVMAATRKPDSPYYGTNPSGRVPFLDLGDGRGYEDSPLVCRYLDTIGDGPTLYPEDGAEGWEVRRLESSARSMMDGMAVWGREFIYRPPERRSDMIIAHEEARALRMADLFDSEMENPVLTGRLNIAQITLGCALNGGGAPLLCGQEWRAARPALATWADQMAERPSFQATVPPPPKPH
ncbi:MAG: glutathione S-transferase N-terminal domain-containing protein [Pseudomonadota bacterium]